MGRWGFAVTLLTVGALMAGCSGGNTEGTALEGQPAPTTVDAQQGTASIAGRVLDAEQLPIVGATVQIGLATNLTGETLMVSTDEAGAFLAQGLAAGTYIAQASKFGYRDAAQKAVTVADGETVDLVFELVALPSIEPYHESNVFATVYDRQVALMVDGSSVVTLTVYYPPNVTTDWELPADEKGDVHAFIMEATWTQDLSACVAGIRHRLYGPEFDSGTDDPSYWDAMRDGGAITNPTHFYVPRDGAGAEAMWGPQRAEANGGPIETSGTWSLFTWPQPIGTLGTPVDVSCMSEAKVDNWWTGFFNGPAPSPEWSALP